MALVTVQIPHQKTLDFGIGVDSNTTSPMNKVVQGEISGVVGADAAKAGFHISRIQSTHELEKVLKIDVNASYGSVAFGAGVADRFSFASRSKIQTSSLFMVITAEVELATHSIDEPTLTPNAAAMVDNPQNFARRFGDMFVRAIGRGGLFVAVMKVETSDEQSTTEISNKLSGAYGMFSADAEVNFSEVRRDFSCDIEVQVYHEGGPVDLVMDKLDDPVLLFALLKTWLKSFADNPEKAAVPYFAILAPTAIANGPLPPNAAETEHAQDVLINCARQRSAILDSLNLMDAIIQSPARYAFTPPTTMADIRAAAVGYQADLDTVAAAASSAMNHPANAKMPAEFAKERGRVFPQGTRPDPFPVLNVGELSVLAARGQLLAQSDTLLTLLRELEPVGLSRTGFDIGLAVAESQTGQGPGKQKFKEDHLKDFDPGAYQRGVDYSVDCNANRDVAMRGAEAVVRNGGATAARAKLPLSNQWLGFNIGAGMFGSRDDGALGNTLRGPGSNQIRERLGGTARLGYDAALAFYKVP
jgi:hypothetical protein